MDFYEWSFNEPLNVNRYGIPEPNQNNLVYPDILLVPLVGFDKNLNRLGYDAKLASDIVFAAAVGGILGSKIYYLIENFERVKADPTGMIFSGAGLVFLGGLMGGTIGVTYVIKKNKLSWIKFADIVAPLLILGYAVGRVGCLLVGDDYGLPTNVPWGIAFPNGLPPSTYSVFQS